MKVVRKKRNEITRWLAETRNPSFADLLKKMEEVFELIDYLRAKLSPQIDEVLDEYYAELELCFLLGMSLSQTIQIKVLSLNVQDSDTP